MRGAGRRVQELRRPGSELDLPEVQETTHGKVTRGTLSRAGYQGD